MSGPAELLLVSGGILATWCLVGAMLVGIGLLLWPMGARPSVETDDLFGGLWVGLAVLVLYLHLWHFALPIRWPVQVAPLLAGAAGLLRLRRHPWRPDRAMPIGRAVVWILVLLRALGPMEAFDSGMYHLPVVVWAREHAIVPGLANLHGRLAFNNSSLLLAAFLGSGPWRGESPHLLNGLLLFLLLLRLVPGAARLRGAAGTDRFLPVFDGVLLGALVIYALSPRDISSLTIDTGVAVALFFAARWLLELATDPRGDDRS